jgi:hypothetical protein
VADGLATNPFVWNCTCIPLPGDSIIINHSIILNNDFANLGGAVVINPNGKLTGDIPDRAFSSTGYFENKGEFYVARVGLFSGTAINSGYFSADSLITTISPGTFVNSGKIYVETHFLNTGNFALTTPTSEAVVHLNFYNGDSAITGVTAVTTNNGKMRINQDFANSDTIRGSGQICIDGNSLNAGVITGTLDFCDQGSGSIDVNWGTIDNTVQFCQAECNVGLEEEQLVDVQVYPNPSSDVVTIRSAAKTSLTVYDISGKLLYASSQENELHSLRVSGWENGIYIYRLVSGNAVAGGKIVKQD